MTGTVIRRLQALGVTMFRINLSHTKLEQLEKTISFIRRHSTVPICLDSEGAQIRTAEFAGGKVHFRESTIVTAHKKLVAGDAMNFNFVPRNIIDTFKVGDFVSIDFNAVLVQVVDKSDDVVRLRVIAGGAVGTNKAVTVQRDIPMPPMSAKDQAAMKMGVEMGIRHFALSFANQGSDVDLIRSIVGDDSFLISKIECKNGIENLDDILEKSDALLIDRGDLSREMPLERIPELQKMIIKRAKASGRKVYVATNLLESMINDPLPTRAEVNDIYNTLLDGADGLVLAAETAIGKFPIRCANMIVRMMDCYDNGIDPNDPSSFDTTSMLAPPHGGSLKLSVSSVDKVDDFDRLPKIEVPITTLLDCEQIANGVYSPLSGFMDKATVETVLNDMKLPSGESWPMPILLSLDPSVVKSFGMGDRIRLASPAGKVHAIVDVTEIFGLDVGLTAKKWFGTDDDAHPGVKRFRSENGAFVAGAVTMVAPLPTEFRHYNLTPEQSRFIFNHRGWSQVVGFHGRNPPHRAHTFIQLQALERTGADGLFINPVIGAQRSGDFLAEFVLKSYQMMLEFNLYAQSRVLLGSFSTYPRFCGPREAVFTAICRQNMGCSHFIIGRDHAGVGNYYGPDDAIRLFDSMHDLKIEPVYFEEIHYNPETDQLREGVAGPDDLKISGTKVRDAILNGEHVPDWMMWTPLQDMLIGEIEAGRQIVAS